MSLIEDRIEIARARYGAFKSSHEALGVITEEYQELIEAIRANDLELVFKEALDLAACATKLARDCGNREFLKRSRK
jgi:NTP pyrophosphatase (non-canonical NTP hydrolase)